METNKNEISVSARLSIGFGIVLAMMLALSVLSVLKVNAIDNSLQHISEVNNVKQRYAINFRGSVHDRAIALRDVTLVGDGEMSAVTAQIEKLDADYQHAALPMDALFTDAKAKVTADEREWLNKIKQSEARATPLIKKIIDTRRAGDIDGARKIMLEQGKPAFTDWLASINGFIDQEEKMTEAESDLARKGAHNFQSLALLAAAIAIAIGVVVAWRVTQYLMRALGAEPAEVKALANAVDRGELYHDVELRGQDKDSIMAVLVKMSRNLRATVTEVHEASVAVSSISEQISEQNQHLSGRTEDQASSLEETASAMEELTATVKQNADSARDANSLAQNASDIASKGGEIVDEVVQTMNAIDVSSRKIEEIISVIDGIAFQTNILALNAAVEAARAGEQGRGFAVVATEVRNLAQRSSTAAREVKTLIDESVAKIHAGTELVEHAGSTMRDIVHSVKQVSDMVGAITLASNEQSVGIEEVNRAISQMDQVTQQNAALVEHAAGEVEVLQEQAAHLNHAVGVFKTQREGARSQPPRAQARADATSRSLLPSPVGA
ncbi:methyl-accepting chemotaxis protein [Pseudoduganella sp. FT25W]|jgi:methyl-accepting chemotaxis protein|uniref:Methyl-accepting chemotaxis protein n=1 Tax=Duganella alba TaxID=2666081 RepID=A0A6L5QA25_9BURK|nr:methyl-accepting chemotaxis protein [Duganella alba]MRX06526.1 methyl-accepting chemotaxis protein [Duganella alba]MRX14920.1 methyl-accepting chemotaxis protein [Duganella alba]